ncbi:ABC transporter substrate-binding protein [Acetobacterium sp.]|jgi:iron complex transport system substrate-binding protein|uniref:ABC transporter substrate-binding protein n=1 Tax=Acetobacterium sp. TaxID=1872094 RepID=UPI000CAFD7AB|nr:ABC transporter substrate-binding protein [Acetobacterium sp.]MDO9491849.1 ABC transporter substrate-binding protein [Acetobacterium sp.]PKM75399.1 MAG: ABC transporter substrate-binding protein [Firmicutes bacterium HGW-Firmicutes-17]
MKKKLVALLLVMCLVMTMATACGSSSGSTTTADNTTTSFTDSAGRAVEVPAKITRIVPSGALAQIALFALAPEMFVGLSSKWDTTAEQYIDTKYLDLPVLGQFYGQGDLNLEEIAKVDPQIIIDIGESKSTIVEDMDGIQEQVGIPTVHIEATMDTMAEAYRTLGKLLGKEKEAEVLAKYCETVNSDTQKIIAKVGESGKTKLVYCTGENGLSVLANGSFHAEVIDTLSNNVAVVNDISSKGTGNPVDMEQLMLWDPDVIIFAPGSIYSTVATNEAWQNLKAIKNGTYYEVPNGPYNWMGSPPSVNRLMGMIWMTQLLYPDQAQYDGYKKASEYYKLFYHTDLTQDQYNKLVANSLGKTEKK